MLHRIRERQGHRDAEEDRETCLRVRQEGWPLCCESTIEQAEVLVFYEAGSTMNDSSSAPSVRDPNTGACNSSGALQSSDVMPLCARGTGGAAGTQPVSPVKASSHNHKEDDVRAKERSQDAEVFATKDQKGDNLEKENEEFMKALAEHRKKDRLYVKEHLGAWSDRRKATGKYSDDRDGRFTYRGEPVNNGGYVDGKLVDPMKERKELGPGEAWTYGDDDADREPPEAFSSEAPRGNSVREVPEQELTDAEKQALFDDRWDEDLSEAQFRRMLRGPYTTDADGRLKRNGDLVDDGGYRGGVLVDVDLEEDEYGVMTDADYETAMRVANHFGVEPRILRSKLKTRPGDVPEEGEQD